MPKGGLRIRTNLPRKGQDGFQPKAAPLAEEELHQIARWLGEFYPPIQIVGLVKKTFGKSIDETYAYNFLKRKKWALLIDRYRQEWLSKIAEVPLFHKKYRLQRLMALIERLDRQMDDGSLQPNKYEVRLLRILDKARLEMEEKKADQHTWYFTNLQLTNASDEELLQRRAELLKRIQEFRLPVRRITHGSMGNRSQELTSTSSTDSQDDGGDGQVRHAPLDLPPG